MTDQYTQAVLARAEHLQRMELASQLINEPRLWGIRATLAAGIAALAALWPSLSAALPLV